MGTWGAWPGLLPPPPLSVPEARCWGPVWGLGDRTRAWGGMDWLQDLVPLQSAGVWGKVMPSWAPSSELVTGALPLDRASPETAFPSWEPLPGFGIPLRCRREVPKDGVERSRLTYQGCVTASRPDLQNLNSVFSPSRGRERCLGRSWGRVAKLGQTCSIL